MTRKNKTSHYGIPDFSMTIQKTGEDVALRLSVGMTDFGMRRISLFGEDFVRIMPDDALLFLTAHWPAISGPYSSSSSEDVEIDLADLPAEKSTPVIMRRSGVFVGFDAIRPRIDLGSHSVVVLECLLRLGDLLHDIVDNENLKVAWQKAKARTQLFPMAEERLGIDDDLLPTTPVILPSNSDLTDATMSIASREFWEETKWLAKQLSQSFVEYCRIAYWLTARNLLAATDKTEVAPTGEEWAWETMEPPPELPPFEVITGMLHRAAKAIGTDVNSVARDALFDRNSWARQIVVYKRWFGERDSRPSHRAGLVSGTFDIELTQFDAETGAGKAKAGYGKGETTLKAINPDVRMVLQGLVGRHVTVEGTATFTAENKTPLSINVSKAELDKHAEWSKARLKKLLRD